MHSNGCCCYEGDWVCIPGCRHEADEELAELKAKVKHACAARDHYQDLYRKQTQALRRLREAWRALDLEIEIGD